MKKGYKTAVIEVTLIGRSFYNDGTRDLNLTFRDDDGLIRCDISRGTFGYGIMKDLPMESIVKALVVISDDGGVIDRFEGFHNIVKGA